MTIKIVSKLTLMLVFSLLSFSCSKQEETKNVQDKQPKPQLSWASGSYIAQNVAMTDAYINSISDSTFLREVELIDFLGTDTLQPVISFADHPDLSNDIFYDDGSGNDLVAGDGIYTSSTIYMHNQNLQFQTLGRHSVLPGGITGSDFQHESEFDDIMTFKFKASISCNICTCSCGPCNCLACSNPLLNYGCFYFCNCSAGFTVEWSNT